MAICVSIAILTTLKCLFVCLFAFLFTYLFVCLFVLQYKSPELLLKYVEQAVTGLGESLEANDSLSLNSSNFGE